jgi:hypothetical protein
MHAWIDPHPDFRVLESREAGWMDGWMILIRILGFLEFREAGWMDGGSSSGF